MRTVCSVLFVLLVAASAAAQGTVLNPTTLVFTKSADHDVQLPDNLGPFVSRYEARWYAEGASAPTTVTNLGKPTPAANGEITASITSVIIAFPVSPSTKYVARVAAIGPAGEGLSEPSNFWLRVAPPQAPGGVTVARQ